MAEETRPTFTDKLSSRKFLIAFFGMAINAAFGFASVIEPKVALTNISYFGFGFIFAEAGVDGLRALGKSGIAAKILPIIEELKKLKATIKKADDKE